MIESNNNFGPIAVRYVNICEVDKLKSPSSYSNVGGRRHAQEIMNKCLYFSFRCFIITFGASLQYQSFCSF